jgi:hypothetical protein
VELDRDLDVVAIRVIGVVDRQHDPLGLDSIPVGEDLVVQRELARVEAVAPDHADHGQLTGVDLGPDPGPLVERHGPEWLASQQLRPPRGRLRVEGGPGPEPDRQPEPVERLELAAIERLVVA